MADTTDDTRAREVVGTDGVTRLIQYDRDGERVRCEVVAPRPSPPTRRRAPVPPPAPPRPLAGRTRATDQFSESLFG